MGWFTDRFPWRIKIRRRRRRKRASDSERSVLWLVARGTILDLRISALEEEGARLGDLVAGAVTARSLFAGRIAAIERRLSHMGCEPSETWPPCACPDCGSIVAAAELTEDVNAMCATCRKRGCEPKETP